MKKFVLVQVHEEQSGEFAEVSIRDEQGCEVYAGNLNKMPDPKAYYPPKEDAEVIDDWLDEEDYKNITPYLHSCLSNMGDSTLWQISISLFVTKDTNGMLHGGPDIATVTGKGIFVNLAHPKYYLKRIQCTDPGAANFRLSKECFMILAKKRKK